MRQLKISKSITTRDSASLDKYLAEIGRHELISAEEEITLTKQIREGDGTALEKLVVANLRFVVSVAKQYQHQGLSLTDLINEGNLGLIKAAKRFDETRGFKFISYAVWWIRQAILQAVAEQSRVIRLPLNKIGALNKIKNAGAILEQDLERPVSANEIAEALDMSESEVTLTLLASSSHLSTDSNFSAKDDLTLLDVIYNPLDPKPDDELIASSLLTEINRVLETLTEREREVVVLFYGIGTGAPFSLSEIGDRFELTRERVRQIKEKAIKKLKHTSRSKLLKTYLG
ncbi:MAG: polymerase sigma factor, sigma-70 family [Bacteroidetes bacterium]|jgi:RNA polymerase primary sigma factor|nr:polymerase sigma factor, sigma-70 family [Bacteroidota bacterium]